MSRRKSLVLLTGPCLLALSWPAPGSGRDPETLDSVKAAHIASRQSIQTCTCHVEWTSKRPIKPVMTFSMVADYMRSLDVFRLRQTGNVGTEDIVCENGIERSFNAARNSRAEAADSALIVAVEDHPNHYSDPWSRALLVVPLPDTISFVPFETLLARGAKVRQVERRQTANGPLIVVGMSYDRGPRRNKWDLEFWFDPKVNYLIRRVVLDCARTTDGQKIHREAEVEKYKEVSPGLYFPECVHSRISVDDQVSELGELQNSNIRINIPLPSNTFRLRYKSGMLLEDRVEGTRYKIDGNGTRIGAPEPFPPSHLPPTLPDEPAQTPRTETKIEPTDPFRWLLSGSLGVLAVGGLMGYLRRRRSSAERGGKNYAQ